MWRKFPPETILPGSEVLFGSESFGFCTGTSGFTSYTMAGVAQPFLLAWDVPFWGSASSETTFPDNYRVGKEELLDSKSGTVEFSVHDPYEGDYRYGEKEIQLVVEVPLVYETWKVCLKEALQGIILTLSNTSEYTLTLVSCETTHGVWSLAPPSLVLPGTEHDFGAESHGLTGSSGQIIYYISPNKEVEPEREETAEGSERTDGLQASFAWDIPVIGSPEYAATYFSVVPTLVGTQCEVKLKLGPEETFKLDQLSKIRSYSIHAKTTYGFENSQDENTTP